MLGRGGGGGVDEWSMHGLCRVDVDSMSGRSRVDVESMKGW